ncbi:mechanosensitive ion channel family protein [Limisalsivibrio acetivorans]|uniref:mechanosensitive ion channel family protein n=1 Tax=Limisalsivibrio acetivorans TaxID=1304888 RepID=UPI0003B5CF70|nr:mechanosensitive ion channel domain-containing protein [Limisalsivibrio acetivorans]
MNTYIDYLKVYVYPYAVDILAALLIFFIGRMLIRKISDLVYKMMQKSKLDETLAIFLKNILYTILFAAIIIAALNKLGIPTASLVAVLGAAGLAIGLSLKDSVSNFGAGVLIIMLRPFKAGDFVNIAGQMGVVENIQVFQTVLKTFDNLTIYIPNSTIMGTEIVNYTARETRMVNLIIGISYDDDIKKARDIMMETMAAHENTHDDPAPVTGVLELGDSSVNIFARSWVDTPNWWQTKTDLLQQIKENLEAGGITIPFPQMDVHIQKEEV